MDVAETTAVRRDEHHEKVRQGESYRRCAEARGDRQRRKLVAR
jgi:hypothetical protein